MDYGTRIAEATNTKNASYGTYNQYAGQADQAKANYDQQFDQRQGYGDIYDAARQKYMNTDEINNARGTYQNSRDAIDQMNTTINKLPESIRQQYGGTGLTEAQRARALGDQHAQMANTYNYLNTNYQNASSDYNTLRNEGLQQAMHTADTENSNQWQALDALQNNWQTLLGQRNTSYGQYQQDLASLAGINTERDNADWKQKQMDFDRWKVEQDNARAAADRASEYNLQKYLGDLQYGKQNAGPSIPNYTSQAKGKAPKQSTWWDGITGAINGAGNGIADWMWNNNIFGVRGNSNKNGGGGW